GFSGEVIERVFHQRARQSSPPESSGGQDHADPRQARSIGYSRDGRSQQAVYFDTEAAVRRKLEQREPILFSLVPTGFFLQRHAARKVGRRQEARGRVVAPMWGS